MNAQNSPETEPYIDRGFTYRVTIASLIVGMVIAAIVGLVLFSLARPLALDEQGNVIWSVGALMFPVSAAVAAAILFWSIFNLPVRIAKRAGVILDPEVWPWTGAVIAGCVVAAGFVAAILLGVI